MYTKILNCVLTTIIIFLAIPVNTLAQTVNYQLTYSSYFGGSDWEHSRDIFVDSQGFVYVTGGTNSTDFPQTTGLGYNTNPSNYPQTCPFLGTHGTRDAYVSKYDPNKPSGQQLVWSRYIGGPCYDLAYAIEVDSQGYIYIAGEAGPNLPTHHSDPTKTVFQPTFGGYTQDSNPNNAYGHLNCFIAKLDPQAQIVWLSYFGIGPKCRDLAIDVSGDIYVPFGYWYCPTCSKTAPDPSWIPVALANAYQKTRTDSTNTEAGIAKVRSDGTGVEWATYFGGNGTEGVEASIRYNHIDNSVLLGTQTTSTDLNSRHPYPGKSKFPPHDTTLGGTWDFMVAKFSANGSTLDWWSYAGGSGDEYLSTHNLAVDSQGNTIASFPTSSNNLPTSGNSYQSTYGGGPFDWGLMKFSPNGTLLNATYIGGNGSENPDGIYTDSANTLFVSGQTGSTDFPTTLNAYQKNHGGGANDSVFIRLSADFSTLLYSTFIGGPNDDGGRSGFLDPQGNMYLTGSTNGTGWPVVNPYQSTYQGGTLDAVLAKLAPITTLPTDAPTLAPKPGDANGDGKVDGADFIIWFNHYKLSTSNGLTDGDFNNSGTVDGADFIIWFNNYKK